MKPVYKIEVWSPAPALRHTITDEAISVYHKEILTSGIGYFSFTVPAKKGASYKYDDIALNDTVKIYGPAYNTVPANPSFIGKVGKPTGALSESGCLRTISGLSQGEILLRRQKKNTYYLSHAASGIVIHFANDLGLGVGDIQGDASQIDMEIKCKSYFDCMQWISDYWVNAGNQIKKDFWVNLDGNLQWCDRDGTAPFRSGASVETLTVGDNIINYEVPTSVDAVKNSITVYGAAEKPLPDDKDLWTEDLAAPNWTASAGTVGCFAGGGAQKVGANYIVAHTGVANDTSTFKRTIPRVTVRDINKILLYYEIQHIGCTLAQMRLHAPNNANYFYHDIGTVNQWYEIEYGVGSSAELDASTPSGIWSKVGTPNWWDIEAIEFHNTFSANDKQLSVDGMYFMPERWSNTASDAASIAAYEQRDLEATDDKLHSDADCQKRAETMLFQMKDPPTQIVVTVKGNDNILLGDRIPMTIPAENISAANYDVIAVEQSLSTAGFMTKATMVDSANVREEMETSPLRTLAKLYKQLKAVNINELTVR